MKLIDLGVDFIQLAWGKAPTQFESAVVSVHRFEIHPDQLVWQLRSGIKYRSAILPVASKELCWLFFAVYDSWHFHLIAGSDEAHLPANQQLSSVDLGFELFLDLFLLVLLKAFPLTYPN